MPEYSNELAEAFGDEYDLDKVNLAIQKAGNKAWRLWVRELILSIPIATCFLCGIIAIATGFLGKNLWAGVGGVVGCIVFGVVYKMLVVYTEKGRTAIICDMVHDVLASKKSS